MDPFGDDDIAQLLRLKRYEQPAASYYENFLSEFRRWQRDELLRQPVWRICFERAHGFALRHNVRPYPAGVAAVVVACAAVVSIKIYHLARSCSNEQVSLPGAKCNGLHVTIIEIRRFRNGWQVYEALGVQPAFSSQEQAIDYATCRACFRWGEIRILDSTGNVERTIHFSETDRKL